jgi:hypothetical protein
MVPPAIPILGALPCAELPCDQMGAILNLNAIACECVTVLMTPSEAAVRVRQRSVYAVKLSLMLNGVPTRYLPASVIQGAHPYVGGRPEPVA